MLVALVALLPPPPPPPPVILSLTPVTAPLRAPLTGDSPSEAASPPFSTALPIGPPPAMSSNLSLSPETLSVTVDIALSPSAFMSACETFFSLSVPSFSAM